MAILGAAAAAAACKDPLACHNGQAGHVLLGGQEIFYGQNRQKNLKHYTVILISTSVCLSSITITFESQRKQPFI